MLYQLSYMGTVQTAKNALLTHLRRPGGKQYFFRRIKGLSAARGVENLGPGVGRHRDASAPIHALAADRTILKLNNRVKVERATRF
ncbi:MAG: hypothetical protein AAFP04_16765, partial [Myxococcota bacterium]